MFKVLSQAIICTVITMAAVDQAHAVDCAGLAARSNTLNSMNNQQCMGQKYTSRVQECIAINREHLSLSHTILANIKTCDFKAALARERKDIAESNVALFTRYASGYYSRGSGSSRSNSFGDSMRRASERSTACAAANGGYNNGYIRCNN